MPNKASHFWLLKSEPHTWSWGDQMREGKTSWDGVRNYQAQNYLKAMQVGDECFFYHSGSERHIVGIVRVSRAFYPDPTDPHWATVDVETVSSLPSPITLRTIKSYPGLSHLALVRQSRLSVMPIDKESWEFICKLSGVGQGL